MTRYAAFLRAINVGGHVVKMDALKKSFVQLGFTNVESFIASGNIVFDSGSANGAALEKKIAAALEKSLGYEVVTFVRTSTELSDVAACVPFKGIDDAPTFVVGFLAAPLAPAEQKKLMALASEVDRFHVRGRELWWYSERGQGESTFSNVVLERAIGVRTTFRNMRTVRKMAARWGTAR